MEKGLSLTAKKDESGATWLPVSEVSARLGVSERAVQKRCASGKIAARRINTPQGGKWEVDSRALLEVASEQANAPNPNTRTESREQPNTRTEQATEQRTAHAQIEANSQANTRTEQANKAPEREAELREQLERERELNGFLRGLIEGHARSEAELRAALREALKAMPKQLEGVQPATTTERGETAQIAPQIAQATQHTYTESDAVESRQIARKQPPRRAQRRVTVWDVVREIIGR